LHDQAKVSKLEVELGNQQVQIEAALKRGDEANTTKAAAVNEKDRIDSAMKMLKRYITCPCSACT